MRKSNSVFSRARWGIVAAIVACVALSAASPCAGAVETLESQLRENRCGAKVIQVLDSWSTGRSFRKAASSFDAAIAYRSPTKIIGNWIEVDLFPDNSVIAYRVTPKSVTRATFLGRNCTPVHKEINKLLNTARMSKAFTDYDLRPLVDRRENALIYAWSPQMPYSVLAFKNAKAVAARLGYKFIPLLDPRAKGSDANAVMLRNQLGSPSMKRIESIELLFRGMTNHFPAALVIKGGKIARGSLPGFKTERQYENFVRSLNP